MAGHNMKFVFVCLLFIVFIFPGATSAVASDQREKSAALVCWESNLARDLKGPREFLDIYIELFW